MNARKGPGVTNPPRGATPGGGSDRRWRTYCEEMGRSHLLAGAAVGALVLIVANVAFSWFATAPDHDEWLDPVIVMTPFAALFGAVVGVAVAALTRPRPPSRPDPRTRRSDPRTRRSEKRKFR